MTQPANPNDVRKTRVFPRSCDLNFAQILNWLLPCFMVSQWVEVLCQCLTGSEDTDIACPPIARQLTFRLKLNFGLSLSFPSFKPIIAPVRISNDSG